MSCSVMERPPGPLFGLRAHKDNVTALCFLSEASDFLNSNDSALISGSACGEIFIWNLKLNRVQFDLNGHNGKLIMWISYINKSILSQGKDGVINVWNFTNNTWTIIRTFPSSDVGFCPAAFLVNALQQCLIVPGDEAGHFSLVDYSSGFQISKTEILNHGLCMCIKVCKLNGENFVVCGFEDGVVVVWSTKEGIVSSLIVNKSEPVFCLDIDTQFQKRGISGSVGDTLETWNIDKNFQLSIGQSVSLKNAGVNCIAIRPDGKIVITGGWDCNVRVFSWKTLKLLAVLNFHKSSVTCLQFFINSTDKNKSVFMTGSKDTNIAMWTIY